VRFGRRRWLHASQNYRRALDDVFSPASSTASCFLLEDDLVLAPDALRYLAAVERLLGRDPSVLTGSIFADNSYPLYAADSQSFRRVSHFAGLGFVMMRSRYLDKVFFKSQDILYPYGPTNFVQSGRGGGAECAVENDNM